jgi:hypothetical protein
MYLKNINSIKKATALSFLLLANTILLIHSAVPHHHHEDIVVCFFNSHTCEHEEDSCPEKCCIIDNDYTPAENKVKTSCHTHNKCNCGQMLFALISNSLNTPDFIDNIAIHFRQSSYIPLFYSEFISQSVGLRAPPL